MNLVHPVCCLRFVSDWTQPLDILSADSEFMCYYLSTKGAWATQPLEQILDSEFLLCELGAEQVARYVRLDWRSIRLPTETDDTCTQLGSHRPSSPILLFSIPVAAGNTVLLLCPLLCCVPSKMWKIGLPCQCIPLSLWTQLPREWTH